MSEPNGFLGRGAFGMPYVQCPDCRKMVYLKPIFGTLHACLSPEERARIQQNRCLAEAQRRALQQTQRVPYTSFDWTMHRP